MLNLRFNSDGSPANLAAVILFSWIDARLNIWSIELSAHYRLSPFDFFHYLKNIFSFHKFSLDQEIVSSAFYIFQSRPVEIQLLPSAGSASSTATHVTILSEGVFSMFRGCASTNANSPDGFLPIGADANISCGPNATFIPQPQLFCLFGQVQVEASISAPVYSNEPVTTQSSLYCTAPPLASKGGQKATTINVKIGMNPDAAEFSAGLRFVLHAASSKLSLSLAMLTCCLIFFPLDSFVYVSLTINSIYPNWGLSIQPGDVLNVVG